METDERRVLGHSPTISPCNLYAGLALRKTDDVCEDLLTCKGPDGAMPRIQCIVLAYAHGVSDRTPGMLCQAQTTVNAGGIEANEEKKSYLNLAESTDDHSAEGERRCQDCIHMWFSGRNPTQPMSSTRSEMLCRVHQASSSVR